MPLATCTSAPLRDPWKSVFAKVEKFKDGIFFKFITTASFELT